MTEVVDQIDLTQFDGKKVVLTYNDPSDGTAKELEGTVETGNALGIIIKPRGKAGIEMFEAGQIEKIELAVEPQKNIGVKYIKEIELGAARQHLLDRHGATLTEVNSITEQQAFDAHLGIDHEASDLGHIHGEKPKKEETAETPAEGSPEAVVATPGVDAQTTTDVGAHEAATAAL